MNEIKIRINVKKSTFIFPQANNIYFLIRKLDLITGQRFSEILDDENMNLTERQEKYYSDALLYLNLIDENGGPTSLGLHIMSFDLNYVLFSFLRLILSNFIFEDYFKNRDKNRTIKLIHDTYNYSHVTSERRSSTVFSWIKWCDNIVKDFNILIEVV